MQAAEYSGDMLPGSLARRENRFKRLETYEDATMERRTGDSLAGTDEPMLIIANVDAQQTDVTYRPTLVLTAKGQLAWVVDFFLVAVEGP